MAKYWVSDLECKIVDRCLQLFGGYCYMDEYPISRLYRDGRVLRFYAGTNENMKLVIARMYWARSNAVGFGHFSWLMLPCICCTDSYS